MSNNQERQIVSRARVAEHGEVYTGEREVNAMLNLVKDETERADSRFLEPACGNGNFMVEILRRKLEAVTRRYGTSRGEWAEKAVCALCSIYGIDILEDNVKEARRRLLGVFKAKAEAVIGADAGRLDLAGVEDNPVRCPDAATARLMMDEIARAREERDSVGGVVTCVAKGVPLGLGEPVYDRFQARLAYYMMGINAAKGFEYGEGFRAAGMRGSEHNDEMAVDGEGRVRFKTNHAGGVLGGITTGEDICFRVAFKPVPTIGREQRTVGVDGRKVVFFASGRHDVCVAPRAVPVVEAMTAILLLDALLEAKRWDLWPSEIK